MSGTTPTPPPLPEQPADQAAAQLAATPPTASDGPAYNAANDPDDTGVPKAVGEASDIGRGFVSALFDISFRTFITRRLASAFYVVGLIAIGIGFLVWFVRGIFVGIDLLSFNVGAVPSEALRAISPRWVALSLRTRADSSSSPASATSASITARRHRRQRACGDVADHAGCGPLHGSSLRRAGRGIPRLDREDVAWAARPHSLGSAWTLSLIHI